MLKEYSSWMDVMRFAASRGDREWVYIITGRSGPTGKTHLYNMLKKNGYNAYEISEDMIDLVDYQDNRNHYKIDYAKKQVMIVLNKRIDVRYLRNDIHGGFVKTAPKENWKETYDEWIKENPHTDITTIYPETLFRFPGRSGGKVLFTKAWMYAMYGTPLYSIKNVIFNDPATIVFWSDGTKTVVKTQEGEIFDPEKGLAMAISKKVLGNQREYYHTFLHWLKDYEKCNANVKSLEEKIKNLEEKIKNNVIPKIDINWTNSTKAKTPVKSPLQKAYDILVAYRDATAMDNEQLNPDRDVFIDLDEVVGYLGEALGEK